MNTPQNGMSAREWVLTEGARDLPWADLADPADLDLFGTYQTDSGLDHVHAQWKTALGTDEAFHWQAAHEAAIKAVSELEAPKPRRKKDPAITDVSAWRASVIERTTELTTQWRASIEALKTAQGTSTIGVYDPHRLRVTYGPLRNFFDHVAHTSSPNTNTIIVTDDAAAIALFSIYAEWGVHTEYATAACTLDEAETALALWNPREDGAYTTLNEALEAARALTATT